MSSTKTTPPSSILSTSSLLLLSRNHSSIVGVLVLLTCSAVASWGNAINVGILFLLQDDSQSTVTFVISNNTGPSETYPTFPVLDNLDFANVVLTVTCANAQCQTDLGGPSPSFNIGSITSGNVDTSINVSSADTFSQAVVSANFSLTSLNLDNGVGGSIPVTGSASTTLTLTPATGTSLVPFNIGTGNTNFDVGLLVDQTSGGTPVPEPATLDLIGLGVSAMAAIRWRGWLGLASRRKRTILP